MKAMLWKELRELGRWAVLATIGLGIAAAISLLSLREHYGYSVDSIAESLLPWLTVGGPLLGAALGLLQILPEQRRDQWAFLVHRPVTRDTLFAGKALAGLIVYTLALGVPALGALVWAAMPGHLPAPFNLRLVLPGVADALTGIAFYFAALLTALRPARWYGSRALPIAAAIVCALLVLNVSAFQQAALIALAFSLTFGLAAWGSFRTTGEYDRQPLFARFCLALILGLGVVTVGTTAFALVIAFEPAAQGTLMTAFIPVTSRLGKSAHHLYRRYEISKGGRILRVTYDQGKEVRVEDLQGHPIPVGKDFQNLLLSNWENFVWTRDAQMPQRNPSYRDASSVFRLVYTTLSPLEDTFWYYDLPTRRILGYSRLTRRLKYAAGPDGVATATSPRPAPFPPGLRNSEMAGNEYDRGDIKGSGLMVYDRVIYALNLGNAKIGRLISLPPSERIDRVEQQFASFPSGVSPSPAALQLVTTRTHVNIYDAFGHLRMSMPRYLDAQEQYGDPTIQFTPDGKHYFFHYWATRQLPSYILETDANGVLLRRTALPPFLYVRSQIKTSPLAAALGITLPPVFVVWAMVHSQHVFTYPEGQGESEYVWFYMHNYPGAYRGVEIVSALCGLFATLGSLLIGRRCAWSRAAQGRWSFVVFWLGLYGIFLLLSLDTWPARKPCPNCGRRRVVTRDKCEHCGAGFVAPQPDGTEIFDEQEAAAAAS